MALVEEKYRTVSGSEQTLSRGFVVSQATSEFDAIDATRAFVEAKVPSQTFWPPLTTSDGSGDFLQATGLPPINQSKYLMDVAVEEIDLVDEDRVDANATFTTVAQYGYRACCPIFDYNLSLQMIDVTQSRETKAYRREPKQDDPLPFEGAIEPQQTGEAATGTTVGAPQTKFAMTWNPIVGYVNDTEVIEYARNIHSYVGKTNSVVFLKDDPNGFTGFPIGSLRFDGFTGKQIDQKNDYYEYRFEFSYATVHTSDGTVAHSIGGVQIPDTEVYGGWEYLWIKWRATEKTTPVVAETILVPQAEQLNYETVSESFDFYNLFRREGVTGGARMIPSSCPGFTDFTTP